MEIVSASWSPMLCILSKRLPAVASTAEAPLGSIVAIAGHAASRTAAEGAAGSSGRPAAMAVAEATTHRGVVVAVTRHRTVAVVHRRIVIVVVVVAVPIVVPFSVVVVIVVVISVVVMIIVMVAMALGRVGLVEVVSAVEAAASMAVATPEGHEHCGTVEEHPSYSVAGVDGERPATSAPDDGTVEPLTGHDAVVLPGAEHIAQVAVANFPPKTEHVGAGIYVEQVVEIDLIHCLILCCCQSELVGHLVCQEERLVACGVVRHCCGGDGYRQHHHQGHQTIGPHHRFLHIFYVLMVELLLHYLSLCTAKVRRNSRQ